MIKRMHLRDKMTLWYTLLTLFTVAIFSVALYFATKGILSAIVEKNVRLSMEQIVAQIENENGMLTFENEVPISTENMYFITELNGSELASYGYDITIFDSIHVAANTLQIATGADERWLLLDSDIISVDHFQVRVRVAGSYQLSDSILSTMKTMLLISIPIIGLIALVGGYTIAKRALSPIRQIIHSAKAITQGDLSARIQEAPSQDELGELTNTLNQMLESVDDAFTREKRFTSDASHELRTPIAVLRAYTESLLSDKATTEEQHADLTTMLNECIRMQKIITQMLTMTRWQEKRLPIHMESVDLTQIANGVRDSLQDTLCLHQISMYIDMPQHLILRADQSLMTELLLNLTENAIKYGLKDGNVYIHGTSKENLIELTVKDDGIGIPDTALPHIFERFYRVDNARDRSGTGLGLSIVERIVKAHDGSITVTSKPQKGTTFVLHFTQSSIENA